MASRFWGRGSDSEDESEDAVTESEDDSDVSDSDSDSSSEGDGARRFMAGSDSSDSEGDKRVVRSAKDRRFEELTKSCDEIRNKMKVNDWSSIQTIFDKLQKQVEKTMKSANLPTTPRQFIHLLCDLEAFLNETLSNRDVKKKMSPTNARALNTTKQRLRKLLPEYDEPMARWRENPVYTDDEEDSEEEGSDDEGEDDDEGEEDEDGKRGDKKKDELLTMDPEKITYEMVSKKAKDVAQARGRRSTIRQEQLEMLQFLIKISKGPVQKLEVLMQLVSTLFDLSSNLNTSIPVNVWQRAARALFHIMDLLQEHQHIVIDETLEGTAERVEEPPADSPFKVSGNLRAFVERLDDELFKILQMTDSHTTEYISRLREEPILLALAEKVSAYLHRINDHSSRAFIALRQAEHFYYKTASVYAAMRNLVERTKAQEAAAAPPAAAAVGGENGAAVGNSATEGEVVATEDEKFESLIKLPLPQDFSLPQDCHVLMKDLVDTIYVHGDERSKARAVLVHIYHKSIHGQFHSARDGLLMSHLQEQVMSMDVSTMILYNRSMAQLGLCAFRCGLILECHSCLAELYGSNKIRELLAQGMSLNRYQEKTPEQEKLERRRQMPFHMHINLEMVEGVYLTCAALLEGPNIAEHPLASTRRIISKPFLRLLETYKNQIFTGPPESVRDHIMAAARAMSRGDWEKAYTFITSLKMWVLMPEREAVQEMLMGKLKQEALRTYLFTYGSQYQALSSEQLCRMFQMDSKKVASVVSSMMTRKELHGSWDQPTSTIVMLNVEASRLQKLAGQVAEKALQLVELNERALALRSGSLRNDDDEDHFKGRRRDWGDEGGFRSHRVRGGRGGRGGRANWDSSDRRRRDGGGVMRGRREGGFGGGGMRRDRYGGGGGMESLGNFRPRPNRF